jgi:hypothetical protein
MEAPPIFASSLFLQADVSLEIDLVTWFGEGGIPSRSSFARFNLDVMGLLVLYDICHSDVVSW